MPYWGHVALILISVLAQNLTPEERLKLKRLKELNPDF